MRTNKELKINRLRASIATMKEQNQNTMMTTVEAEKWGFTPESLQRQLHLALLGMEGESDEELYRYDNSQLLRKELRMRIEASQKGDFTRAFGWVSN